MPVLALVPARSTYADRRSGEVMAKELGRVTAESVELISLNPSYDNRILSTRDLVWMARIFWASQ